MTTEKIKDVYEIYENLKPLNYGRRLVFQSYCKYLVKVGQIEKNGVEKFLSDEFLYEDNKELERVHNKVNNYEKFIDFTINATTFYGAYRLIKSLL